jgi:hypothetical protein
VSVLVPAGAGRVAITLEDGSFETGDLLIGADGIWSKVRRQMIGESSPCYSGYTCYTGEGGVLLFCGEAFQTVRFILQGACSSRLWGCSQPRAPM